jgi:hypothetical protein
MKRHYALIAILIVAGCSEIKDQADRKRWDDLQTRVQEADKASRFYYDEAEESKYRVRELEAQIAQMKAQQQAPAQTQQPPKGKKPTEKTVAELMKLLAPPTERPGIGKTKAEIKTLLGPPDSSSSAGRLEEWVYRGGIFDPVTEKPVDLVLWIEKITEEVFYFTATYSGDKHFPAEVQQ